VIDVGRVVRQKKIDSSYAGPFVIINPCLLEAEGTQMPREGCLSVPDLLANVRRAQKVRVRCLNERGEEMTIAAHGFEALALQHEIDHLEGRLFLDRVSNLKTDVFRRKGSG
jgi:peptide deformylase